MILQAVVPFAAVLILASSICADTNGRTTLRITGGICHEPKKDSCVGMGTRNSTTDKLFQRLGRTKSELRSFKFQPREKNGECTNGGKFNGFQWVHRSAKPISHAVLLDKQGTIAGMQFLMPYSEVDLTVQPNYRYDLQPAIQNQTIDGVIYFYITVYFVNPRTICTMGRSSHQLDTEGTVSQFYIQMGPSPNDVMELSLKSPSDRPSDQALLQGWNDNNCFRWMGWHRFYKEETWDEDDCATFLPFFLMYSSVNEDGSGGDLNGFGFVVPGKATSIAIERPTEGLTMFMAGTNNNTESVPKCLAEAHRNLGISSMHVFLTEEPYNFLCPSENGPSQPALPDSYELSTEKSWNWNPLVPVAKISNVVAGFLNRIAAHTSGMSSSSGNLKTGSSECTNGNPEIDSDLPICVIGGGFSGIGIALEFQNKYKRPVVVFEKENRVGGKVLTYREEEGFMAEVQVDMCPLLISKVSHRIKRFMKQYKYTEQLFDENDRWVYSTELMKPIPVPRKNDTEQDILNAEVLSLYYYKRGLAIRVFGRSA